MDPSSVATFHDVISAPRLGPYLARYEQSRRLALRLYAWNIELSTALWGPLAIFEVLLRNTLHERLALGRQDDWWNSPNVHLHSREQDAINRTIQKLEYAGNSSPTPDDVVGASSLGFWVGLLDQGIPRDPYLDYQTALWEPRLKHAFPHATGMRRRELHGKLNQIRKLRNRIAHHEPIHRSNSTRSVQLICEVAGFMDLSVADFIRDSNRVAEVEGRKREALEKGNCCI